MTSSQASPINSSQPTPPPPTSDPKKESIEDSLSKPFDPLDVQAVISAYDTESARLSEYEAEFNEMLLSAILEVRAWALARPVSEQDTTGDALAVRVGEVRRIQDEQGRFLFFEQTRLRLLNFINSIKSALAALTTGI